MPPNKVTFRGGGGLRRRQVGVPGYAPGIKIVGGKMGIEKLWGLQIRVCLRDPSKLRSWHWAFVGLCTPLQLSSMIHWWFWMTFNVTALYWAVLPFCCVINQCTCVCVICVCVFFKTNRVLIYFHALLRLICCFWPRIHPVMLRVNAKASVTN